MPMARAASSVITWLPFIARSHSHNGLTSIQADIGDNAIWCLEDAWGRFDPCAAPLGNDRCLRARRRRFPGVASPTRRTLQPEATGAVMEVTKWLKPSV